ncbi:unnamed protein product [Bursaphelenchus xylophilus]|uniref:(pine wood nematode) hypothetical protein n=1 Tax=Bursaphelenchus xylophilus TaxID=6326 RepID=A0A1I7RJE0_BURXY|nr:unnamed protein product [Bursaphelenchus xylophilus]CAG9128818.1 unnamed protein product [Bursaphelenchus xylophilus]
MKHLTKPPESVEKTPWMSIVIVTAMAIFTSIQSGLYYSSMWPYLQKIDVDATESFLGAIISIYSFGQIIASPLVGWYSNYLGTIKVPVSICICLQILGNLIYFYAQAAPTHWGKYIMMLARFVLGLGSSNLALLNTYACTASTPRYKSRTIALVTGGIALGISLGPGIQLFFLPLGKDGIKIAENLYLNLYTAPAVGACVVNVCALSCLLCLFDESYAGTLPQPKTALTDKPKRKLRIDWIALILCHVVGFVHYCTFTNVETLGTTFAMTMMGFTEEKAISFTSIAFTALSLVELVFYLVYIVFKLERWGSTRCQCLLGLMGLLLFYTATFSWPFLPGELAVHTEREFIDYHNHLSNISEPVGCNIDRFSWCFDIKPISPYLYLTTLAIVVGLSFGIINTTLSTLFSEVLGPKKQGTQQGFFHMTKCSARMVGPMAITFLYRGFGPRIAWSLQLSMLGGTILLYLAFYKRMIPMQYPAVNKIQPEDHQITTKQV